MLSEKDLQSMTMAGLSYSQARIYLTLAIVGQTSIKTIAKAAKMDPGNTDRVILSLQKLSLVNKTIGKPNLYEAIPVKEGVEILLKRKKEEITEIIRQTDLLLEHFENRTYSIPELHEDQFLIIPPKTSYIHVSVNSYNSARKTIDLVTTYKRSLQSRDIYREPRLKAIQRGVRIRVILDTSPSEISSDEPSLLKTGSPNPERRFVRETPKVVGGIFDGKIATFLVNPAADYLASPCLLTNHAGFISMFQCYFEKLWSSANPKPEQK